ncbi:MAG: hypothetical protein LBC59_00845 [Chitinispirillales bacterium]|jgi:hypothetical protein|nr:hypothetical protein [Chitinispirillales bacterium]
MNNSLTRKPSDNVWWDYVTGPSHFISETLRYLHEGKSVCLITQNGLPFRGTFFDRISDTLCKMNSSAYFDFEYVIENTGKPGDHLIRHLGLRSDYRPNVPEADFIHKNGALSNRLSHIVTKNGDNVRDWLDFIKSYKSNSLKDGLFLLEINEAPHTPVSQKYLEILKYDDFITEYDSHLFAGLITDNDKLTPTDNSKLSPIDKRYITAERQYITAIAVSFFGTDVERIDDFIRVYKIAQNPFDTIPENFFPDKDSANEKLWNAQVQELFPFIMRKTRDFVNNWRDAINEAINVANGDKNLFPKGLVNNRNERITTPDELEIGTLFVLMCKKRTDGSDKYILCVPNQIDLRKKLEFWRDMRNNIAHGKICQPEDVERLLKHSK